MKYFIYLFLFILLASSGLAAERGLHSPIIDEAGILTAQQVDSLGALLLQTYNSGVAEHAVVILESSGGQDLALLATELGNDQLGNTETDNGLLTVIAVQEREYFTAVGYGLEGDLNDAKIGRMQREYLVPYLANDDYYTGLQQFIIAVQAEINITDVQPNPPQQNASGNWWYELIPFAIFFIFIAIHSSNRKKGGRRNDGDAFLAAYVASSFFRGGGRGGFGGGGFGGFGGGGFGGGGAGGGF